MISGHLMFYCLTTFDGSRLQFDSKSHSWKKKSQYLELKGFLMAWNDDLVRQGIYEKALATFAL